MSGLSLILAAVLTSASRSGVEVSIESETKTVDPAKSVFVTVRLTVPRGESVSLPDLRARVEGFSLAEDFVEEPTTDNQGATHWTANWRLLPEPCADVYKIRALAVGPVLVPSVYFDAPPAREPVTGAMECDPKKDLPPLSWRIVGFVALGLVAVVALGAAVFFLVRFAVRKIKEHRMSPIERAWLELDRLLKKGLPGRGHYKDFYVELTMVVRRYVQRKYGVRAPHLTTEEFLREFKSDALKSFLESADLVKFAGVEATPEMADAATASARNYLKLDSVPKSSD